MARNLTAADRSALIRLASTMPAGSDERRAILARLSIQLTRDELEDLDSEGSLSLGLSLVILHLHGWRCGVCKDDASSFVLI